MKFSVKQSMEECVTSSNMQHGMMMHAGHVFSTAVGFDTVEMKHQQIRTGTLEPVKPPVQAGSTTEPQGVYTTL